MASGAVDITGPAFTAANAQVQEEAVAALTNAGICDQAPSQKVVNGYLKEWCQCTGRTGYQTGSEKIIVHTYYSYIKSKQAMKPVPIPMKQWLAANERTRVLPGDQWYLNFQQVSYR